MAGQSISNAQSTNQPTAPRRRSRNLFFQYVLLSAAVMSVAIFWAVFRMRHPDGVLLNRIAWEASYKDRLERIPAIGPREGYWGVRQRPIRKAPGVEWINTRMNLPGLLEIDNDGTQHLQVGDSSNSTRILIVGASVAYGSDASSIAHTYFAVFARELHRNGYGVNLRVLATGGWLSKHELAALKDYGFNHQPNLVVLLDGLNDITQQPPEITNKEKVSAYLRNVKSMAEECKKHNAKLVVALQPSIVEKKHLTPIEEKIVNFSLSKVQNGEELVRQAYVLMREGLTELVAEKQIQFVDLSRIFEAEKQNVFADLWHFADFGHQRLGITLAAGVLNVNVLDEESRRSNASESRPPQGKK